MFTDWKGVAVIVGGALIVLYVVEQQAKQAIVDVGSQVDITSRGNAIYQGFSRLLDGWANDGRQLDWWDRAQGWFK